MIGERSGSAAVEAYFHAVTEYLKYGRAHDLKCAAEAARRATDAGVSRFELVSVQQRAMLHELIEYASLGCGDRAPESWDEALDRHLLTCKDRWSEIKELSRQQRLEAANEALRRVNEIRESEARRIAQALHDESSQLLATVHLAVDEIGRDLPPRQRTRLARVTGLLNEVQRHLRHLSHELVPSLLAEMGLGESLEYLREGVEQRYGVAVSLRCELGERLSEVVETAVYRVIQEAITNACTHGQATRLRVWVRVRRGRLLCSVRDNGVGFDLSAPRTDGPSMGIGNMRERVESMGGRLLIESKPGKGTAIVAEIRLDGGNHGGDVSTPRKPVRAVPGSTRRRHAHTSAAS